jgi:hypothetical protein
MGILGFTGSDNFKMYMEKQGAKLNLIQVV